MQLKQTRLVNFQSTHTGLRWCLCKLRVLLKKIQELKESTKSKTSQTTLYIDNKFYDQAKTCLNLFEEQPKCSKLLNAAKTKIAHKKWTLDAEANSGNGERKYTCTKLYQKHILPQVTMPELKLRNTFKCLTIEFPSNL